MVQSSDWVRNIYRFLSRIIGFIRSQTRRNASTSTIAEANLDVTRSIFVRARERSTTYRVKRSSDVAFLPCGAGLIEQFAITGERICRRSYNVLLPVTRHSFQAMRTVFSRKDFSKLFDGLLRNISTRETNAEPRCLTSPWWSDLGSETPRIGPRTSSGELLYEL